MQSIELASKSHDTFISNITSWSLSSFCICSRGYWRCHTIVPNDLRRTDLQANITLKSKSRAIYFLQTCGCQVRLRWFCVHWNTAISNQMPDFGHKWGSVCVFTNLRVRIPELLEGCTLTCFVVTWTILKYHLLKVGISQNQETKGQVPCAGLGPFFSK